MTHDFPRNTMLDGALVSRLRADIEDCFAVSSVEVPRGSGPAGFSFMPGLSRRAQGVGSANTAQGIVVFVGQLLGPDSEAIYDRIAARWQAHDYTPMLRPYKGQVALIAQPGLVAVTPTNPWINFWFVVATVLSMLITGSIYECLARLPEGSGQELSFGQLVIGQCFPRTLSDWADGVPMTLAMMAILLAHEFGHYFAARYHKVAVTLPYFIPVPLFSPVGTLGAVIQLRSPFKTKKQLFDIGVAGPLGGLIFAIPLIFWAVKQAPLQEIQRPFILEGNSIFYLLVKYIMRGELLPNFAEYEHFSFLQEFAYLLVGIIPVSLGSDILLNTFANAAWFGLFITAMNLLPVGQLDGGHVIYCLLGDKAAGLGLGLIGLMVLAGLFLWPGWLLWAGLVFFIIGPHHPPPLNDLIELGTPRKLLAYLMIFIFIILFMPNPLQQFL
jgi:Zn-dependent protease